MAFLSGGYGFGRWTEKPSRAAPGSRRPRTAVQQYGEHGRCETGETGETGRFIGTSMLAFAVVVDHFFQMAERFLGLGLIHQDRKSVGLGKECVSTCRSRWSAYH